jgi:hypothetical protein
MAYPKVLAFLLCESAIRGSDGKVSLRGLFDRIIVPRSPANPKLFFVFYKVVVEEPCTVSLRVIDPSQGQIQGNWRDSLSQPGPVQSIWAVTTALFSQPGQYVLELREETNDSEALSLASMLLVVNEEGG